jgi:hypothetical protein
MTRESCGLGVIKKDVIMRCFIERFGRLRVEMNDFVRV